MRQRTPERLDRGLWMSLGLHLLLGVFVLSMPGLFPAYGESGWGSEVGGGEGVRVEIVSSISGIPLPAPEVVNEAAVANESPGFYESETAPEHEVSAPEEAVVAAELLPETTAPVETTAPPPPSPEPAVTEPEPPSTPDNAVPFGQGGRPAISSGQFALGDGTGAVGVGEGAFGERYGRYVESITQRISGNWLQPLIDAQIRSAPRVYVSFSILRNGTIENVEIEESSGIFSVDQSARRAVFASNPLSPLPSDFRGGSVSVRFWFEYSR